MNIEVFRWTAGFIVVAICWGATNPFIKRGSEGIHSIKRDSRLQQFLAEIWFLCNIRYLLPLSINLCGSAAYYYTLSTADLSIAVPITNAMTFIFTVLTGYILMGEPAPKPKDWLGIALVSVGVSFCVLSKTLTI